MTSALSSTGDQMRLDCRIDFVIGLDPVVLSRVEMAICLLNGISGKIDKMVATIDQFISDMTAKMTTQTTEIAGLKVFIDDLFAKIGAIPGLTQAQMTALDAIEVGMDTAAQAILDAQKANTPPAPAAHA